ncbi:unnamed protein product [Anisakis simplex]|uniref:Uncharacterized protein n=1 Tax=Anisakis simplex TaxID=6269 RepID=A0A3P6PA47_ANISI|nr:unnamed protein product [Anisakis simplex]
MNECCIDTQKCERLGDETLCQNQFVECLRSKIRLNPEEDKKCYEAIQAFTAASAPSSDTEHKSSGLVNTIQIWSHETKELFVNITNRVKNHLENTPLKKLLLLVIIIVVACMFAYMTFLNDDKVKWLKLKTPVKFAHEKARLIQMI